MIDIDKYKEIVILGLDKRIARQRGGLVLDEFDPAVDHDRILRSRVERLAKRKNTEGLERILQDLIRYFEFNYDQQFASVLFQLTGYKIMPIPPQLKSIPTKRQVRVGNSGKEKNCLTFVTIELPTGSGSIYCIKGRHPALTADWVDPQTLEIKIPIVREEIERVTIVRMYSETIKISYKEISQPS